MPMRRAPRPLPLPDQDMTDAVEAPARDPEAATAGLIGPRGPEGRFLERARNGGVASRRRARSESRHRADLSGRRRDPTLEVIEAASVASQRNPLRTGGTVRAGDGPPRRDAARPGHRRNGPRGSGAGLAGGPGTCSSARRAVRPALQLPSARLPAAHDHGGGPRAAAPCARSCPTLLELSGIEHLTRDTTPGACRVGPRLRRRQLPRGGRMHRRAGRRDRRVLHARAVRPVSSLPHGDEHARRDPQAGP